MTNDEYFEELPSKIEILTSLSVNALELLKVLLEEISQKTISIFLQLPIGALTLLMVL